MDNRIQIWNILHDGEITSISEDNGTLVMFVSIPYLRRRIKPLGDSIVVTMTDVTLNAFHYFEGNLCSLIEEIEDGTPAILSTQSESMPVTIETTMGQLVLNFKEINFSLDTGQPIEFSEIETQCEEYWKEWEKRGR